MSWSETWIDNFDDNKLSGTLNSNPTAQYSGSVCESCYSMGINTYQGMNFVPTRYDTSVRNAPIAYLNITESNSYLRYTTAIQNVCGQRWDSRGACGTDGVSWGGLILYLDYNNSYIFGPKNIPIITSNQTGKITRWGAGSNNYPVTGKEIPGEDVNTREIQYRIVFDQVSNSASFWLSYDSGSNWHGLHTASNATLTFTPNKIGFVILSYYDTATWNFPSAIINYSFLKIEQGTPGTSTDDNTDGWTTIYEDQFETKTSNFQTSFTNPAQLGIIQTGNGIHLCTTQDWASIPSRTGQWGPDPNYNMPYYIGNRFTYPTSGQKVRYSTKVSYMTASRTGTGNVYEVGGQFDQARVARTGLFLMEDKENAVWNTFYFRSVDYNQFILSASKIESDTVTKNLANSYVSPVRLKPIYLGLEIDGSTDEVIWVSSSDGNVWEAFHTGTIGFTPQYVGMYLTSEAVDSAADYTPFARVTYDYLKEEVFSLGGNPEPITTCYLSKFNGDFSMNHYNCLKNEHRDITDGGGVLSAPFSLGTKFLHIRRPK
jgi:hypothetical protein